MAKKKKEGSLKALEKPRETTEDEERLAGLLKVTQGRRSERTLLNFHHFFLNVLVLELFKKNAENAWLAFYVLLIGINSHLTKS